MRQSASKERPIKASRTRTDSMSTDDKDKAKELRDKEVAAKAAELKTVNDARTGVGTRVQVGLTRGKNPTVVTWEAFDEDAKTRPTTIQQFMQVTNTTDEPVMVSYLIDGYNDAQYSGAADEIGEFVNRAWKPEVQTQFRTIVRQYVKATGMSLEDVVGLVKPAIDKAQGTAA